MSGSGGRGRLLAGGAAVLWSGLVVSCGGPVGDAGDGGIGDGDGGVADVVDGDAGIGQVVDGDVVDADVVAGDADPTVWPVVGVESAGCSLAAQRGSAVLVSAGDGQVLVTSAHVVAGAREVTVSASSVGPGGVEAEVVALDPASDLAVLRVSDAVGDRLGEPIDAVEPSTGAASLVIWDHETGTAVGESVSVERRLRVTIEDIFNEAEVERSAIELDTAVVKGDSGGAVISDDGDLWGVVYATSRGRGASFAVAGHEVVDLVGRLDLPPEGAVDRCVP